MHSDTDQVSIDVEFRCYLHEAWRCDRWRQDVPAPHPAGLIRRDPVALRAPNLGNPLPFLLCNLLIASLNAAEQREAAHKCCRAGKSAKSHPGRFPTAAIHS